jgi:DNA invertase Pin-like site-specific DNA recombinase
MTNYGYARCSTTENRQDIHRQTRELVAMGIKEENIFWEYESGTKDDRVQLNRLMEVVKEGDSITSLEVSRLTRSTQKLCEIIKEVQEKKIRLVIAGSLTVDCTPGKELDPLTKGMLMMWGVFAELEHDMIVQRVKSGMENARAKGKKIGRPRTNIDNIPSAFYKYYPMYNSNKLNLTEFAKLCGMTRATIYKYLNILEHSDKEKII